MSDLLGEVAVWLATAIWVDLGLIRLTGRGLAARWAEFRGLMT